MVTTKIFNLKRKKERKKEAAKKKRDRGITGTERFI